MEKAIQIYISKKHDIYMILYHVHSGWEMSFYGDVQYCNQSDLNLKFIYDSIIHLLNVNDEEFITNEHTNEHSLIGYSSFQDLYKKTYLIDLRIENSKIFIYIGLKVKRWYEFDPIDDWWYHQDDNNSIHKLSLKLIELITK